LKERAEEVEEQEEEAEKLEEEDNLEEEEILEKQVKVKDLKQSKHLINHPKENKEISFKLTFNN
jgi:hypothetical protein